MAGGTGVGHFMLYYDAVRSLWASLRPPLVNRLRADWIFPLGGLCSVIVVCRGEMLARPFPFACKVVGSSYVGSASVCENQHFLIQI